METSPKMPVVFVGHGNPMNILSDNRFTQEWARIGRELPRPKAILSISAHWITPGKTMVHVREDPRIIYDFYGFPDEMYQQQYDVAGSSVWARRAEEAITSVDIAEDTEWGLDHGSWTVLIKMFPLADIPVFQMSIDYSKPPQFHYELTRELAALRREGVLVLASGNLTHNLQSDFGAEASTDWASEFDDRVKSYLDDGDDGSVVDFLDWGSLTKKAHPSHDHFLPLVACLGLREESDEISYFAEGFDMGTLSMRSFVLR